jgi:hypothetical protein
MRPITLRPGNDSPDAFNVLQGYDLRIIPLFTERSRSKKTTRFSSSSRRQPSVSRGAPCKVVVGLFALEDLGPDAISENALLDTVIVLDMLRHEKECSGLVIRVSDNACPMQITDLLYELCKRQIAVIIMCDPNAKILTSINFGLLVGAIFENACILRDGHHRDFFRSARVRELMGICTEEKVERPEFFVGFHDLWHVQPTAGVVRRAYKLAQYFGATLEHGLALDLEWELDCKLPISLSGFDYLKRSDVVEVYLPFVTHHRDPC